MKKWSLFGVIQKFGRHYCVPQAIQRIQMADNKVVTMRFVHKKKNIKYFRYFVKKFMAVYPGPMQLLVVYDVAVILAGLFLLVFKTFCIHKCEFVTCNRHDKQIKVLHSVLWIISHSWWTAGSSRLESA